MSKKDLRAEAKFSPCTNKQGMPLEVKEISEEVAEFTGYASVFGVEDSHRDVVMPGAFDNTVKAFQDGDRSVVMLYQHDWGQCIGHYTSLSVDDVGLKVTGRLHVEPELSNPLAVRAWSQIKLGILKGLSIGFRRMLGAWDEDENNWKIFEADVFEISTVWIGSNPSANISAAATKLLHGLEPRAEDLEKALMDLGFSQRAARGITLKGISGAGGVGGLSDDAFKDAMARLSKL